MSFTLRQSGIVIVIVEWQFSWAGMEPTTNRKHCKEGFSQCGILGHTNTAIYTIDVFLEENIFSSIKYIKYCLLISVIKYCPSIKSSCVDSMSLQV